ncbi:MAG: 3'-5' exonuclease [Candidatus Falkowbacteria bacterium]
MNEIKDDSKNWQQGSLFERPPKFYLFFDTETTGLPKNYNASYEDLDNWPRVVQLAWVLADENKNIIEEKTFIIKPDGFTIPAASSAVHGITDAKANEFGIPVHEALAQFNASLQNNNVTLVAHNISFDISVMAAEFLRASLDTNFLNLTRICTMKSSIAFCNLPNRKFPKLAELYRQLFNEDFANAHDALADVLACSRCFFEMKIRNII